MAPWRRRRPGRTRRRFLPLVATVNAARVLDATAMTDVAAPAVAVHEQHASRRDGTAAWQQRPARPAEAAGSLACLIISRFSKPHTSQWISEVPQAFL